MTSPDRLSTRQWRTLTVSVYLPMALSGIGLGAVTPLLSLRALELGATPAEAAFVVALLGIGGLLGALPAGVVAGHFGEKRALVGGLVLDGLLFGSAYAAPDVRMLGALTLGAGLVSALLIIARQAYVTEYVPFALRARALSTVGGMFRVGSFVGPLVGAGIVAGLGLAPAFLFAGAMSLVAAALTAVVPDLHTDGAATPSRGVALAPILRDHARTFATLGLGAAALMLVRSSRDVLIPLWCNAQGLDAAATSLIYGLGAGIDLLLFYVGGSLMDRLGRRAVAVPAMLVMGACFGMLPLTASALAIGATSVALGLGNGISAGVVMTLGSDASPARGRPQFLAGWRLTTGLGSALGPVLISAITAAATLAWASVAVGAVGLVGAAWLWHWGSPERLRSVADRVARP